MAVTEVTYEDMIEQGWTEPALSQYYPDLPRRGAAGATSTGLFECPYDGQRFSTMAELAAHLLQAHPTQPGGYQTTGIGGTPMTTGTQWGQYALGSPEYWEEKGGWGYPAAYKQALGLTGRTTLAPHEEYLAGMYEPLAALGGMQGALAQMPGYQNQFAAPGPYMTQWMQPYTQSPSAMYGLAQQLLGQTLGMPFAEREQIPGMTGTDIGGLLGMGLRPQLGPGAQWLAGRVPAEMETWQQQYPEWMAGAGQPSFLGYLKEKYNLGRYF